MAEKIKYTEKELKQPDKFTQAIAVAVEYIAHHFNRIAIIVGIIIAVLLAAYLFNVSAGEKTSKANSMFEDAETTLRSGDMESALAQFETITEEYPGEKISALAYYQIGVIKYNSGSYDESIKALQEFIDKSGDETVIMESAVLTQGLASYKKGDWQKAVDYLTVFENKVGSPYEIQAKEHLAKAYDQMGEKDKAETIRKQLKQQSTNLNRGFSAISESPN